MVSQARIEESGAEQFCAPQVASQVDLSLKLALACTRLSSDTKPLVASSGILSIATLIAWVLVIEC